MTQSLPLVWQKTVNRHAQWLIVTHPNDAIDRYSYHKYRCCGRCELLVSYLLYREEGRSCFFYRLVAYPDMGILAEEQTGADWINGL
jgi:hypothetical protein